MRPNISIRPLVAALLFAVVVVASPLKGTGAAVAAEQWIHIRVVEQGAEGETVHINLPLQLVEKLLPLVDNEDLKDGRIRVGRHSHLRINERDLSGADLREIWQAVRTSPEGEFVTVTGKKESVRVARQGGHLIVKSEDGESDKVEIRVPTAVMDALFSSKDPQELDLVAAVKALARAGGMELVAVDDDDSRVRIWVDSRHDSD